MQKIRYSQLARLFDTLANEIPAIETENKSDMFVCLVAQFSKSFDVEQKRFIRDYVRYLLEGEYVYLDWLKKHHPDIHQEKSKLRDSDRFQYIKEHQHTKIEWCKAIAKELRKNPNKYFSI